MITVAEAVKLIQSNLPSLPSVKRNLYKCTGLVIAEDVFSPINMPPFPQSAMDGYALKFSELSASFPLCISGELQAGAIPLKSYPPGSAVRIFTGAMVPDGFDTVVMQEKTRVEGNLLFVLDELLKPGTNVRPCGSQNKKGDLVLSAGTRINAGVAGYLAGLGLNEISVYSPPIIHIINTGNEIVAPGSGLPEGKIYESNSYSLNAVLSELGAAPAKIIACGDDEKLLTDKIRVSLQDCDLLIITGGVSVGDYDFVSSALDKCAVSCLFHKVKQKPGKPLYFGKKENRLVFGLPGNPAAVLTCFYEYIAPIILKLMGHPDSLFHKIKLPLASAYTKKPGLTHFLKGKITNEQVMPLHAQESYLMNSFAVADCLIELTEEQTEFKQGDLVSVLRIHF